MEFCPECRGMMFPVDGVLTCKSCGYTDKSAETDAYKVSQEREAKETVRDLGEKIDMRSTIKETCPECGHDEAHYELKQTRSADEAPTRFFTCAKCGHNWREYS